MEWKYSYDSSPFEVGVLTPQSPSTFLQWLFLMNCTTLILFCTWMCLKYIILTPKVPRPFFFGQKPLKTAIFVAFIPKNRKKTFFPKSNHKIFYFTCLKSSGKIFIKFDCMDWKILAFKVVDNKI